MLNSRRRIEALDLVEAASKGDFDPVIGREAEIRRMTEILLQRHKNNPVLLGPPGVGKTALVEGLAQRIASGQVPASLHDCRLISVNIGSLISGTTYRGQFEERMESLIHEVESTQGKTIVFLDELHLLMGAGRTIDSSMDAANLLKPALARGQFRCIGATTLDEYRRYVEKDAALERRFQPVRVEEPSAEDTMAILRVLKSRYEQHYEVAIRDSAIQAAVELSVRYIPDRFLPDKAKDLLDQAASRIAMGLRSGPPEIQETESRIIRLRMAADSLASDPEPEASMRRAEILVEHREATLALQELNERVRAEREGLSDVEALRRAYATLEQEFTLGWTVIRRAQARGVVMPQEQFLELADLQEKQANLKQRIEMIGRLCGPQGERLPPLVKKVVDGEEIARLISERTGVPAARLVGDERERLCGIEDELRRRVVDQDHAIAAVADAVRRGRVGFHEGTRPIGSFLFLGPTGVGKTELAKALASFLFGSEQAMIRLDMSEYGEAHTVSRLVGAAPGYAGYEEGGYLTEAVRRRPYAVVLLDEIEKAHRDVFNVLLQVLDDGRLTDGQGRTVDFRSTILILTSNIGGQAISRLHADGAGEALIHQAVLTELRGQCAPEFLNRIDETIVFRPLTGESIRSILDVQIAKVLGVIAHSGVGLLVTDMARAELTREGFEPDYGARPLKRVLLRRISNPVARMIVSSEVSRGDHLLVDWDGAAFVYTRLAGALEPID